MVDVRSWFKEGGVARNIIILAAVFLFIAVVMYALTWVLGTGLFYMVVVVVFLALVAIVVGIVLFRQWLQKYRYYDLLRLAFMNLYNAVLASTFNYEAPFVNLPYENATIDPAPIGMVQGRTMLPVDEYIDEKPPEDKEINVTYGQIDQQAAVQMNHARLLDEMGEPQKTERRVWTEDGKSTTVKEDNIIWVFRVRRQSLFGKKDQLWLAADSQISDLSRDATGDIATGRSILVYGNPIKIGPFMVIWNNDKQLERAIKGIKTVCVMAAMENYISRLAQLTVQDMKTRQDIAYQKEARKHEEDADTD